MLAILANGSAELSIVLVDDERMRRLNREYRGIDRPTDVLAFAQTEGESGPPTTPLLLGDVVVSVPTAMRQAHVHSRALLDELTTLLAHGLLHLFGYDHATRTGETAMTAQTKRLCLAAEPRRRATEPRRVAAPGAPPAEPIR